MSKYLANSPFMQGPSVLISMSDGSKSEYPVKLIEDFANGTHLGPGIRYPELKVIVKEWLEFVKGQYHYVPASGIVDPTVAEYDQEWVVKYDAD